jgi:hypothetical protein
MAKVKDMAARIIELRDARCQRSRAMHHEQVAVPAPAPAALERFHFWSGASAQPYVHTVYSLIDCPAIPSCTYILVQRDGDGTCHALSVGRVAEEAPSLNLARIRQLGATLGANEVHLHLLAGTAKQAKLVEFDLRSGLLDYAGSSSGACLRH